MSSRLLSALVLALSLCSSATAAQERPAPRLVLAITVDQLRADLPARVHDRFGEGGFRLLYERGIVYADAQFAHAITETAVGHATLFTGATPARHGIVANEWAEPETGASVYSCKDAESPWVGDEGRGREGRSPRNLLATTIGDQLLLASAGRAKVFGISVKDRSAILPAGHAGKAIWLSSDSGRFVSSAYYYESLPDWLAEWNSAEPARAWSGRSWTLLADPATYLAGADDDRPFEGEAFGLGRTFPHALGDAGSPGYLTRLTFTPFGDELLEELAERLIEAEGLGADGVPDLLAISFSMTDTIGHVFGPGSLEAEDNLLRLDRTLARLFAFVDARVGLARTLVVLSADHGVAEAPERMSALGVAARRLGPDEVVGDALRAAVSRRFRVSSDLIRSYHHPYVHLDLAAIRAHGLDQGAVERAVAAEVEKVPGISRALSMRDVLAGVGPDDRIARRVRNSYYPGRSGEVHVVTDPYTIVVPVAYLTATHGSPWSYDAHVPLVFAGAGLERALVTRPVGPENLAPTLALVLGVGLPSAAFAAPLDEVVQALAPR